MCIYCGFSDHVLDDGFTANVVPGSGAAAGGATEEIAYDVQTTVLGLPTNKPAAAALPANSVGRTILSPESGNEFIDSFINNGRHYVNADGSQPTSANPFVIGYYFSEQTQTPAQAARGVNTPYSWRPFETAAYERAVVGWEAVANVDFVRAPTQASALFNERLEDQATAGGTVSASHSLPSASTTAKSQGNYNFEAVNIRQWTPDTLEPGGNFFRTFIHETGHGLGLKHPHDPGSGAFNPNFFPGIEGTDDPAVRQRSLGVLELNHMFGSVMSYLHGYEFDDQGHIDLVATRQRPVADDFFLDHGFAATPMAYDIAATQYLYGANTTYASGNNVYILPDSNDPHPFVRGEPNEVGVPESIVYQPDTAFWSCIWDTGGIDEMRYDGSRDAILDLTAATLDFSETGYGVLSYAAFIGGGYTIANGVVIENATGGEGNDRIVGNEVSNVLIGRGGDDLFIGKGGADILTGGAGADTYQGTAADLNGDTVTDFDTADRVVVEGVVTSAVLNGDTLSFVENGATYAMTFLGAQAVPLSVTVGADGLSTILFSSDEAAFGSVVTDVASTGGQIYAVYDGLLGRAPTAIELERAAGSLESGGSLRGLASDLLSSSEGQGLYGGLDNTAYVNKLYEVVLGRTGEPEGVAGWVNALNAGASRADVGLATALSGENQAQVAPLLANGVFVPNDDAASVARLYYGILDRAPDRAGLTAWTNALDNGLTLKDVAGAFLNGQEYAAKSGGLSDAAFVDQLYDNALGRDPDVAGATAYNVALATGGLTRADVALDISNSLEATQRLSLAIEQSYHVAA